MRGTKFGARLISAVLSCAILAGASTTTAFAASSTAEVPAQAETGAVATAASLGGYTLGSGGTINGSTIFDGDNDLGWTSVDYPNAAAGIVNSIYQPRVAETAQDTHYVTEHESYLEVESRVWTEKQPSSEENYQWEYVYADTSILNFDLEQGNYKVNVTLTNPTNSDITVSIKAGNVTKISNEKIAAGETKTVGFIAVLLEEVLELSFLETSSTTLTSPEAAEFRSVYVSAIELTAQDKIQNETGDTSVYIVSDSTVQTYYGTNEEASATEGVTTGWGQMLYQFFGELINDYAVSGGTYPRTYETSEITIENHAIGGRSSLSFINEGRLDTILEEIKVGDYLFVQWGHNDATYTRPNRYVSSSDFYGVMKQYVDGATMRGATVVLITPVSRYSYSYNSEGELQFNSDFEAYRQQTITLAEDTGSALLDLTAASTSLAASFGVEGAKSLFRADINDFTHLSQYGAYKFGQLVAKLIVEDAELYGNASKVKGLAELVTLNIPEELPGAAENLEVSTVGGSSVTLKWDAANDAELYYIYRWELDEVADDSFDLEGFVASVIDEVLADDGTGKHSLTPSTTYMDGSCTEETSYVYLLRAFNEKGMSDVVSNAVVATTKSAEYRFDFGPGEDQKTPIYVQDGWTLVTPTVTLADGLGFGWEAPVPGPSAYRDMGGARGTSGIVEGDWNDMEVDFILTGAGINSVFTVDDMPNGTYELTGYAGYLLPGTSTIQTGIDVNNKNVANISANKTIGSATGVAEVVDGQMHITLYGRGGSGMYINGITLTTLQLAPQNFAALVEGTSNTTVNFRISFGTLENAVSYNVYMKSEADESYSLVKTITAEQYANDFDNVSQMSATLGEVYQLYVTGILEDGSETLNSNIVELAAIDDSVTPPSKVADVYANENEVNKRDITIRWDANSNDENVLYYNIYRSSYPEDSQHFTGWTKAGDTLNNGGSVSYFTDDYYDLIPNVSFYYMVQAVNAGGKGEMSDVYATPITYSLNPQAAENLADRGVVAVDLSAKPDDENNYILSATDENGEMLESGIFLSWRVFEDDPEGVAFTVYRNGEQIASGLEVSNMVDLTGTASDTYKVVGSSDGSLGLTAKEVSVWDSYYLELELDRPDNQAFPDGTETFYTANDMTVADLTGDGVYDLVVKWYPANAQDNSQPGYTGTTIMDGYTVDWSTGEVELLWRIDLGLNIRSGAHYTQFQVWDLDGDGKAEVVMKTAEGTVAYDSDMNPTSYVGADTGMTLDDALALDTYVHNDRWDYRTEREYSEELGRWLTLNDGHRWGYVLEGPEYLSVFNGETGEIMDTVAYEPARGDVSSWGDGYGNRVDRFLSGIAYLDGEKPYAVFTRGYYTRIVMAAYSWDGTALDLYWVYDSNNYDDIYAGQGDHSLAIADVDGDGKDEIVFGGLVVNQDGTPLYSTGLGHGDAMHVSSYMPWIDGQVVMSVHEEKGAEYGVEVRDAATGEVLSGFRTDTDVGRGLAGDIDPTSPGAEYWASDGPLGTGENEWNSNNGGVFAMTSGITLDSLVRLSEYSPSINFSLYWNGDLLTDMQDHVFVDGSAGYYPVGVNITSWDYQNGESVTEFYSKDIWSSNGTKGNLGLVADVLGDWREEIIARAAGEVVNGSPVKSANDNKVRVYTTTIQTDYVLATPMDNRQYREGVAWQNVGYNQPTHTDYMISSGLITSELGLGEVYADSIELLYTQASDGAYGHDITGYEVWVENEAGEYELHDFIPLDEMVKYAAGGSDDGDEDGDVEYTKGETVWKFDFGNGNTDVRDQGYTRIIQDIYSADVGYGFTVPTNAADINFGSTKDLLVAEADDTALYYAVQDAVRSKELVFNVDIEPGKYMVEVYAYAGTGASNVAMFRDAEITVNGQNLGTTPTDSDITLDEIRKEAIVSVGVDGQIVIEAINSGTNLSVLNAVIISKMEPVEVEEPEIPEVPEDGEILWKFDFGNGNTDVRDQGYTRIIQDIYSADVGYGFTVPTNAADINFGSTKDLLVAEADDTALYYAVQDAVRSKELVFNVDIEPGKYMVEVYAYAGTGASNVAMFRDAEITVNGQNLGTTPTDSDITLDEIRKEAIVSVSVDGQIVIEAINSGTNLSVLNAVIITKLTGSGEQTGGGDGDDSLYVYTMENLTPLTEYNIRMAARVETSAKGEDGEYIQRSAEMSKTLTTTTPLEIGEVLDIDVELVQDTPIPEDGTLADLMPESVPVRAANGDLTDAEVANWDVSNVDIATPGEYSIVATLRGMREPVVGKATVVANKPVSYEEISLEVVENTTEQALVELLGDVTVFFKNGTEGEFTPSWDFENPQTTLDLTTAADGYLLVGAVETAYGNLTVEATIDVVVRYITGFTSLGGVYVEIDASEEDVLAALPTSVVAHYNDGSTAELAITGWDLDGVDTAEAGETIIKATIEEAYDEDELFPHVLLVVQYPVVAKFDIGNGNGNAQGFETLTNASTYTEERGFGFTEGSFANNWANQKNNTIQATEYDDPGLYEAVRDAARANNTNLTLRVDLTPGTYEVEVYAYAFAGDANSNYQANYGNIPVLLNGEELGTALFINARNEDAVPATLREIAMIEQVEVGEEGCITVTAEYTGGQQLPYLNAIVIRLVEEGPAPEVTVTGYTAFEDIIIYEGEDVSLPETAEITLSNGETTTAAIEWDTESLNNEAAGSYELIGVLPEWSNYEVRITVVVNTRPAQDYIVSVEEPVLTIEINDELVLPETVKATYQSGTEADVAVVWQEPELDLTVPGVHTITGTVEGYGEITLTLYVVDPGEEDPEYLGFTRPGNLVIFAGTEITAEMLPATVTLVYSNGSTEAPVVWDTASINIFETGEHNLPGTVPDTDIVVNMTVVVKEDRVVSVSNVAPVEAELGASLADIEALLPASVTAQYESGKTDDVAVSWNLGNVNVGEAGTYTIVGTADGYTFNVSVTIKAPVVVDPVDKDALQELFDEYRALEQGDYTDESWDVLQDALDAAERILLSDDATQDDVNNALAGLAGAVGALAKNHDILEGENPKVTGAKDKVVIRVNGDVDEFIEVRIGGKLVDPANYTVESGSVIITLLPEYLATLANGTYTLEIVFIDGTVDTALVINREPIGGENPDDGDEDDDDDTTSGPSDGDDDNDTNSGGNTDSSTNDPSSTGSAATGDDSLPLWALWLLAVTALGGIAIAIAWRKKRFGN